MSLEQAGAVFTDIVLISFSIAVIWIIIQFGRLQMYLGLLKKYDPLSFFTTLSKNQKNYITINFFPFKPIILLVSCIVLLLIGYIIKY